MCSEGVSVWFACKLCKSFFLNADDFAYHKKKSHVQEFRNTKFIVFEEQTSPAASPPENWVSFFSPKEETRIHKIISPPTPSTTTIGNYNPSTSSKQIQTGQNEKLIEIEPESEKYSKDLIDGEPEDAAQVSNNNLKSVYKNNTVQSATQSQHNPYVSLKRLKLKNSRNLSSHSNNSTIHSEVNSLSNINLSTSDVISMHKPGVTASTDQNKFNRRSSTINFPPLPTHYVDNEQSIPSASESILPDDGPSKTTFNSGLLKCGFCCKKIKSSVFQMHVMVCENHSVNQNRELNIFSNKKLYLNPDNLEINFRPSDLLETVKTEYTDEYEESFPATGVDEDPFEYESRLESSSAETEVPSIAQSSPVDLNHREISLQTEVSRHCVSCKKYFNTFKELKYHNKNHHMTQGGKLRFKCPHLNCEITARDQYGLRIHLMQVHSNARLFKCPHPDCKKSFKTTKARNGHLKIHTKPVQSGVSKGKSNV